VVREAAPGTPGADPGHLDRGRGVRGDRRLPAHPEAAELTNIGILLAFVVVCIAIIVLRYRQPDLPRTFRTPGMPVTPAVGVIFSIWLITFLSPLTWLRFLIWFLIGLVVYFAYSRRRSVLNR
jgi:basic amino acid/polyamine antiporter, APA family